MNPDHLFLGTHADNMADMHAKGRAGGNTFGRQGEAHPLARLTPADVSAIQVVPRHRQKGGQHEGPSCRVRHQPAPPVRQIVKGCSMGDELNGDRAASAGSEAVCWHGASRTTAKPSTAAFDMPSGWRPCWSGS